jgi:hypothetical protein
MAHKKHSVHRKAQRFEWLTEHFAKTKAQGFSDSQKLKNIPQTRRKTKVTSSSIKSVSVVSNFLGLILVSIAIQCRILF